MREEIRHCAGHATYAPKCSACWHAAYGIGDEGAMMAGWQRACELGTDDAAPMLIVDRPRRVSRAAARIDAWALVLVGLVALGVFGVLLVEACERGLRG